MGSDVHGNHVYLIATRATPANANPPVYGVQGTHTKVEQEHLLPGPKPHSPGGVKPTRAGLGLPQNQHRCLTAPDPCVVFKHFQNNTILCRATAHLHGKQSAKDIFQPNFLKQPAFPRRLIAEGWKSQNVQFSIG